MAEFTKVMRQAKRMCKSYGDACGPCVLHAKYGSCPLCAKNDYHIPADWKLDNMPEVERSVMDWAAAHPEPRYPTWTEWQDANFPDAYHHICPGAYLKEQPLGSCKVNCEDCYNQPIPADIAEKLGIKPVEVSGT